MLILIAALATADLNAALIDGTRARYAEISRTYQAGSWCQAQADAESAALDLRKTALKGRVVITEPRLVELAGTNFYDLSPDEKKQAELLALDYDIEARQHAAKCRR